MAYREIRDKFMKTLGVSSLVSLKAPFFLWGTEDVADLDLKNLRYLWKGAVDFNCKDMRQQASPFRGWLTPTPSPSVPTVRQLLTVTTSLQEKRG